MQTNPLTAFGKLQWEGIHVHPQNYCNNLTRLFQQLRPHLKEVLWYTDEEIHNSTYKSTYSRFSCSAGHYTAVRHWSVELCKTLDSVCLLFFEGALADLKVWYGAMPLDSWTVREKHSSEETLQQPEITFTSLYNAPRSKDMELVLYLLK